MTTIAKEKSAWYAGVEEFRTLLVSILDFSYFSDVHYLLFAVSNFLLYTFYDVPYVYLGDNATQMGFSHTQSSMLIAIIGILNMVGEVSVCCPWGHVCSHRDTRLFVACWHGWLSRGFFVNSL